MPNTEQAMIAQLNQQIASDPRAQEFIRTHLGRGTGAIDPKYLGIQAPPGYVFSLGSRSLVKNWDLADKVMTAIALGGMTMGTGMAIAGGPAAAAGGGTAAASEGGSAALAGIPAGTLPGGAAAPIGAVGGEWAAPTLAGIPAGTLPGGGQAPNVTPGMAPGSNPPVGLGQFKTTPPPQSFLSKLTDPSNLAQLSSILPALIASQGGGGNTGSGANGPQLDALMKMAADRAQRTDPLHQMVTRLAESRMPINSRTPNA